jgi:hypothetical protein
MLMGVQRHTKYGFLMALLLAQLQHVKYHTETENEKNASEAKTVTICTARILGLRALDV